MENIETDALSSILRSLRLKAGVYVHADFCGTWAVDTSGQRKVSFHLIGSGKGWLHMTGLPEPRLLSAGDLVLFPHDHAHIISSQAEPPLPELVNQPLDPNAQGPVTSMLCGYFEFASRAAWPLLDQLPNVIVLDLSESSRIPNTRALIQLIVHELEQNAPGVDAVVNELAYVLFVHVLRCQISRGLDGGILGALFDSKIGRALNLMHSQPAAQWTLEQLAAGVNMSRSAFAEQFKALVGMTPVRYLTQWRMQQAMDLLQTTDLPMIVIAERCGYSSEIAFRKAFKSVIGEPPGKVRRAYKGEG